MTEVPIRNHVFHFGVPGHEGTISISVPVSHGTKTIKIERDKTDVRRGKPGIAMACADMICASRHKDDFPHPIFFAEGPHNHKRPLELVSFKL